MAKASDNTFPKLIVSEGSTPSSPSAGSQKLFLDSADHKLKRVNSSGAVTTIEGGGGGTGETSWTNATLTNSWVTFGGSYPTPGYRKDSNGIVHLRGVIKSGTNGTSALTLPTGYRPAFKCSFPALNTNAGSQVDVNTDGTVVVSGSTAYMGLDSVSFYID